MISKTYIKYTWLLNTLLRGEKSLKEIETLWKHRQFRLLLSKAKKVRYSTAF